MPLPPTKRLPDLDPGERFYAVFTGLDGATPVNFTTATIALLFDHKQLGTRAVLKTGDAYTTMGETSVIFDAPPAWTALLEPGEYEIRIRLGTSATADRLGPVNLMTVTNPPAGVVNAGL